MHIAEGVAPVLIDNAARQLGFPVGPIQLGDETSIDLAATAKPASRTRLSKRSIPTSLSAAGRTAAPADGRPR